MLAVWIDANKSTLVYRFEKKSSKDVGKITTHPPYKLNTKRGKDDFSLCIESIPKEFKLNFYKVIFVSSNFITTDNITDEYFFTINPVREDEVSSVIFGPKFSNGKRSSILLITFDPDPPVTDEKVCITLLVVMKTNHFLKKLQLWDDNRAYCSYIFAKNSSTDLGKVNELIRQDFPVARGYDDFTVCLKNTPEAFKTLIMTMYFESSNFDAVSEDVNEDYDEFIINPIYKGYTKSKIMNVTLDPQRPLEEQRLCVNTDVALKFTHGLKRFDAWIIEPESNNFYRFEKNGLMDPGSITTLNPYYIPMSKGKDEFSFCFQTVKKEFNENIYKILLETSNFLKRPYEETTFDEFVFIITVGSVLETTTITGDETKAIITDVPITTTTTTSITEPEQSFCCRLFVEFFSNNLLKLVIILNFLQHFNSL